LTDDELLARATMNDPSRMDGRGGAPAGPGRGNAQAFRNKMYKFLKDEGALVVLQYGNPGDGGTIFATGGGSRDTKRSNSASAGEPDAGTLQPHRAADRGEDSGQTGIRYSDRVPHRRSGFVQHRR